jgi:hypothetical protein
MTGIVTWRIPGRQAVVGTVTKKGYRSVEIGGSAFQLHNIIWKMETGLDPLPGCIIDHVDNDQGNNKWGNLREATHSQNSCNKKMRVDNRSGLKGVGAPNKWGHHQATITVNGRRRSLGYFADAGDAHAAYVRAAKEVHGEFARVG